MATATARKTAAKKATTKATPAPAKKATAAKPKAAKTVAESPANGQHRKAILEELARLGWEGPTSYTVTSLREDLLPWVAAGKPADAANIPVGAMNHAHPKPKAAKAKRLSKGYLAALADVLAVLDQEGDVREFATTRLANGEDAA